MLIKIFGTLDILTAIIFILNNNFDKSDIWLPNAIILFFGVYLLLKGFIFTISLEIMSILDIICAILIIISASMHLHAIIAFLVALFLLQKGILSILE